MNWYALVVGNLGGTHGKLVCIGNCGDWEEAYEVACDAIGETEWAWLASEHEVEQWVECIAATKRGEAA